MTAEELTELADRVLPDSVTCDLLPYYAEELRKLVEAAVKAERDACAKVCDDVAAAWSQTTTHISAFDCASSIRARSNT